jgi:hypothetical protein
LKKYPNNLVTIFPFVKAKHHTDFRGFIDITPQKKIQNPIVFANSTESNPTEKQDPTKFLVPHRLLSTPLIFRGVIFEF